ncbi:radical SAM family heme chaperone HemW [Brevibacillus laterosporus]|uniref:radical SAM family heme chaperone HemW n=1 Tax=Brevibacillus laterosporus TaxID=1465 RepID=UPI0018F8AB60|nr:radical SAM family heme chaperone HemW [Brevibacillus laterosporus]MBG9773788.1 coproporphyrinogen III oxidase [Brevibacillus laterosporus]
MAPNAVYIHIPFCTNKCYYCDFNSFVTNNPQLVWDYLEALRREMALMFQQNPPEKINTIFVGGGTPTYLDQEQMSLFLHMVNEHLAPYFSDDLEWTMEANPGTTDLEKLKLMRSSGVNRISFGVQSFQSDLLKRIGRIHDVDEVYQSVNNAVQAGFDNISIDLMFGLPDQTMEMFAQSLEKAMELPITHLSSYGLKVEENTLFHTLYQKDQLPLPTEDAELEMYLLLIETLEKNGMSMYEISNFAKSGKQSRHNKTYWLNQDYYGIGAGAHGYVNGRRHVNAGPLAVYTRMAMEGSPRVEEFEVTQKEAMEEQMILGLRLREGVDMESFAKRFGRTVQEEFGEPLQQELQKGMLEIVDHHVRLTSKGLPLGNEVFAAFLRV